MKRIGYVLLAFVTTTSVFAEKRLDPATLQDVQPTNFAVAKKQHQQYDFSIVTAVRNYQCRTPENKKINATDFVVGSSITFESNGRNGEVKTIQGKSAKCMITRVQDAPQAR